MTDFERRFYSEEEDSSYKQARYDYDEFDEANADLQFILGDTYELDMADYEELAKDCLA